MLDAFIEMIGSRHDIKEKEIQKIENGFVVHDFADHEVRYYHLHQNFKEALENEINHLEFVFSIEDICKRKGIINDKWYGLYIVMEGMPMEVYVKTVHHGDKCCWVFNLMEGVCEEDFPAMKEAEEKLKETLKKMPENRLLVATGAIKTNHGEFV